MPQPFRITSALGATLTGTLTTIALSATSANAASMNQFQLSGGVLLPGGTSTVTLNSEALVLPELDFNPEPTPVGVTSNTGIFAGFDTASIEDIISFGPPTVANNPFIDFGHSDLGVPSVSTLFNSSIDDDTEIFHLNQASYSLKQSGLNVSIYVALFGFFDIGGELYDGAGNLTFQTNNTTVAEIEQLLADGGSLTNMTFSGALFTATTPTTVTTTSVVPEPLTIFGAGAALGFGGFFKRKLNQSKS
ncbi:PEP-CTERM sorting domain-containing protein [Crocosphaera sp.]|uniref:PEP-CTERM sorting domain-containing protein n=1 Tax=Crocosphaera sp. TaxID=2729996 RepID=UPI003F1E499A|nr:PEP-CTERM sorting domain-containing protein [Crocosphaera sp.]